MRVTGFLYILERYTFLYAMLLTVSIRTLAGAFFEEQREVRQLRITAGGGDVTDVGVGRIKQYFRFFNALFRDVVLGRKTGIFLEEMPEMVVTVTGDICKRADIDVEIQVFVDKLLDEQKFIEGGVGVSARPFECDQDFADETLEHQSKICLLASEFKGDIFNFFENIAARVLKFPEGESALGIDVKTDAIDLRIGGMRFVVRFARTVYDKFPAPVGIDRVRGAASTCSLYKIDQLAATVPVFGHETARRVGIGEKITELRFHVFMIA